MDDFKRKLHATQLSVQFSGVPFSNKCFSFILDKILKKLLNDLLTWNDFG